MPAPFANLSVVLVEPSSPGNIGAVARVLRNTGISNLHLVNPCPWDNLEARARAHGSTDILESCRLFPDLASAVSEAHIVIGTTHRDGRNRVVDSDPRAVVEELGARHEIIKAGSKSGDVTVDMTSSSLKTTRCASPLSPGRRSAFRSAWHSRSKRRAAARTGACRLLDGAAAGHDPPARPALLGRRYLLRHAADA